MTTTDDTDIARLRRECRLLRWAVCVCFSFFFVAATDSQDQSKEILLRDQGRQLKLTASGILIAEKDKAGSELETTISAGSISTLYRTKPNENGVSAKVRLSSFSNGGIRLTDLTNNSRTSADLYAHGLLFRSAEGFGKPEVSRVALGATALLREKKRDLSDYELRILDGAGREKLSLPK